MREQPRPTLCAIIGCDPVAGLDLADAFDAAEYFVAGPFTTGKDAHAWLSRFTPDVAVVDQGLADSAWMEILRELQRRKILVLILASPETSHCLSGRTAGVRRLEKPAATHAIIDAVRALLHASSGALPAKTLAAPQQFR